MTSIDTRIHIDTTNWYRCTEFMSICRIQIHKPN